MMDWKIIANGLNSFIIRRLSGPFWIRRKWLDKTQWYSRAKLENVQFVLLKQMLEHAEQHVPYYQEILKKQGLTAADFHSLADINRFPILTKKDVLDAGDSLVSRAYPKMLLRHAYTGGTTGTPTKIYRSPLSLGNEHAFVRRQWEWAGVRMSDRTAYLTGRVIVPPNQTDGDLFAYDPIMKELILSTYHLNQKQAEQYIEAVKRYKIKALVGYPSAISFLARICIDNRQSLNLNAVLTSSETLTESMRNSITQAFSCPVFDFYGSAERVCYIFTCEEGSYHLQPEYGLTELIPIDDTGTCRVVSTGFWNKAMPLIRYEMGDVVVASEDKCSCGRSFPVIKSVSGRKADTIKTPSGREFGAAILTHLLYGTDHILESQIIQDRIDHILIDYVPSEKFNIQDYRAFERLIRYHLPSELEVEFRSVNTIAKMANGKLKPVLSLMK